jgi:hypothetical protein
MASTERRSFGGLHPLYLVEHGKSGTQPNFAGRRLALLTEGSVPMAPSRSERSGKVCDR